MTPVVCHSVGARSGWDSRRLLSSWRAFSRVSGCKRLRTRAQTLWSSAVLTGAPPIPAGPPAPTEDDGKLFGAAVMTCPVGGIET